MFKFINKFKFRRKKKDVNNTEGNKHLDGYNLRLNDSLRLRMTLIMTITVIAIIVLCWVINRLFLQSFYENTKLNAIEEAYKFVNSKFTEEYVEAINDNTVSDEEMDDVLTQIERTSSVGSLSVYIYKKYKVGGEDFYQLYYPTNNSQREINNFKMKIKNFVEKQDNINTNILKKSDKYMIYKIFDNRLKFKNLELVGQLDSGVYIIMNTNFESVRESANISNRFLAYIGIIIAIVASIIMYFISNNITKPILELSDIAKKMANLEFDVKYKVDTDDEIGVLGSSINSLSTKLEKTISELKNANNELLNDLEQKEKIDHMRKEFLSNVSHELKTPIALIQGYAEGLNENINDDVESRQFYCDVIIDEAKKMNNMVKKLLDLNHIEFGDSPMEITRFDIVTLIKGIISATDILFQQKDVNIEFSNNNKVFVWADQYMIEEVLINYISNALNHVDDRRVVRVSVEKKDDIVRISVFNTGKCIPEDDIDKIWDKFYKVDKARTREYGGSGVGLSIVKAIIENHHRQCGVINREDGVEFWFELDGNKE